MTAVTAMILSDQTAAHLEAWLENWTRDDGERDTVRAEIVQLVASDVSLLDTHTWTEMRAMAEAARPRYELALNPNRADAYCTPGDHRIHLKGGTCGWCGRSL